MKIVALCKYGVVSEVLLKELAGYPVELVAEKPALLKALPEADVLVMTQGGYPYRFVDEEALAAAPRLKLVQTFGVMWDALDLEAATGRGIPVANAPGTNNVSVAEIALFLLLGVAKGARRVERAVRERRLGYPRGVELYGKTLCIVGFGRIGVTVAVRARSLGMEVVAVDLAPNWAMARAVGAAAIHGVEDLDAALGRSGFVLLTLPLTEATLGLMDAGRLAAMPAGSCLVNVSRGPIVDRAALESALDSGHLAGYGADAWWEEPAAPEDPLLRREEVFYTPHLGAMSEEAVELSARLVRENVDRLARGLPPRNVVNGVGSPSTSRGDRP